MSENSPSCLVAGLNIVAISAVVTSVVGVLGFADALVLHEGDIIVRKEQPPGGFSRAVPSAPWPPRRE